MFSQCVKSQRRSKCGPRVQQMECFHNVCIMFAYQDVRKWRRHYIEKVNKEETETLLLTDTVFHYANLCNTIFYHCFHFSTSSLNSSSCLNVLISSTNHIHPFTHIVILILRNQNPVMQTLCKCLLQARPTFTSSQWFSKLTEQSREVKK